MSPTHRVGDVRAQQKNTNYFASRSEAGKLLAEKLQQYRYEDTIVLALSEGAVSVGAEIARSLHSLITMLLTKDVYLPDGRTLVGVINEVGGFSYNNAFSTGEIEELETEYRSNIEFAKMQAMHELHVALGQGGLISPEYFRNRVVIVVSDGTLNGMAFDMASDYLKGVKTDKVIMVTPVAGVPAVDRMHILADELFCLNVTDGNFEVDHYYEDNKLLSRTEILATLNDIILSWHKPEHTHTTASV
ncbi:MAG: phosphoribosyltransferase family protein [Candidatus Saccharimonadales bacterium]